MMPFIPRTPVLLSLALLTLTAAQAPMTGNEIIINLNTLSLAYQDLTVMALALPRTHADDDGQKLVDQYANITAAERGDEDQPQPTAPLGKAVQYAVVGASHALVLEDRRFLAVLSDNYIYFGLLQRQKLVKLLGAQVKIVTEFDRDATVFAPEVLDVLLVDDAVLIASLRAASAVLKAHS